MHKAGVGIVRKVEDYQLRSRWCIANKLKRVIITVLRREGTRNKLLELLVGEAHIVVIIRCTKGIGPVEGDGKAGV